MAKTTAIDPNGRVCKKCGSFKNWEHFDKKNDGVNGRHSQCKPCIKKSKCKWWKNKSTRSRVNPTILEFSKPDICENSIDWTNHDKAEFEKLLRSMVLDLFCSRRGESIK